VLRLVVQTTANKDHIASCRSYRPGAVNPQWDNRNDNAGRRCYRSVPRKHVTRNLNLHHRNDNFLLRKFNYKLVSSLSSQHLRRQRGERGLLSEMGMLWNRGPKARTKSAQHKNRCSFQGLQAFLRRFPLRPFDLWPLALLRLGQRRVSLHTV
jgi:hypothetical protein